MIKILYAFIQSLISSHSSLVTRHSSLVTRHWSLIITFALIPPFKIQNSTFKINSITRHWSLITLILFPFALSFPQTVFTPVNSGVYDYLERMSLLDIIEYHNEVLPLSRKEISFHLEKINESKNSLSRIDREELAFFYQEYAAELGTDNSRWFLFDYKDSLFSFYLSPIAGYGISSFGGENGHSRWWGVDIYGYGSDWFGASVNMRDIGEFGGNVDKDWSLNPHRKYSYKSAPNGIEFNDVRGSVTFDWQWGSFGLLKDYMKWGHGKFGSIILSDNVHSYPFIRLALKPVDWFRFYYVHAWLNSNVLDSSAFYYGSTSPIYTLERKRFINKYLAANLFSFTPWDILDVSIGNSFVYSGPIRPEMFIPFLFFKHLDTNTGRGSIEDGNGQFFFDLLLKYPETFSFYTTVFVDVIEIRNVIEGDFHNTWFGYTVGANKADLFIPNLDASFEYTRINPWVYEHKDITTTYKHLDYGLGHWIGQNADQFRLEFNYTPIRGLDLKLYTEFLRKGGLKDIFFAYKEKEREEFLYSPVRKDKTFGFKAKYEYIHDLFAEAYFQISDISDEDPDRTPGYMLGNNRSFGLSLYYGL